MIIEKTVTGYFEENCYIYLDRETGHGFIIDPGKQTDQILSMIKKNEWTIEKILLTYGQPDHFKAAHRLGDALGIPVCAHGRLRRHMLENRQQEPTERAGSFSGDDVHVLEDGEVLELENGYSLKVIYTPGYTEDAVTFYSKKEQAAFVGDTIFWGKADGFHYPGGTQKGLRKSTMERIFALPDETILFSRHTEATTVNEEKNRVNNKICDIV